MKRNIEPPVLIIRLQLFCLYGALCAQAAQPFDTNRLSAGARFRDVSESVGFPRNHKESSCSAVWADYDGDGDLDVLTIGHLLRKTGSITQLWRNDSEAKKFTDVTVQAGLKPENGDCHGPIWADFDNDGYVDLLARPRRRLQLFR